MEPVQTEIVRSPTLALFPPTGAKFNILAIKVNILAIKTETESKPMTLI